MRNQLMFLLLAFVAYLFFTTLGCTGGGSLSSSGESKLLSSLSVTKAYPSTQSATFATPQRSSRYYIKGLSATIQGVCTRGTATIRANEGGADYSESSACGNDGIFTWEKTFSPSEEGDKTLFFKGYDASGAAIAGSATSVLVRIDNTAPPAPTLVTPSSSPYDVSGSAQITVQLTSVADTESVTGPASAPLTLNGSNYEYPLSLVADVSVISTFYAVDFAGNTSAGTSVTIRYLPTTNLNLAGSVPGLSTNDVSTSFTAETTVSPVSERSTDSGTSYILETGFNYIMNQIRND